MSIGGYYAAEAAVQLASDLKPAFQILLYPVVSMMDDITFLPARQKMMGNNITESTKVKYSAELNIKKGVSPALIIACQDDTAVNPMSSLRYYRSLSNAHVPAELHLFTEGGHGFAFQPEFPHLASVQQLVEKWLQRY